MDEHFRKSLVSFSTLRICNCCCLPPIIPTNKWTANKTSHTHLEELTFLFCPVTVATSAVQHSVATQVQGTEFLGEKPTLSSVTIESHKIECLFKKHFQNVIAVLALVYTRTLFRNNPFKFEFKSGASTLPRLLFQNKGPWNLNSVLLLFTKSNANSKIVILK